MSVEAQKLNVQIIDKKFNKKFNLYPASYACNIVVTENPLMTLDEWIADQEKRNSRYDKALEKINALGREGTVYVIQEEEPTPNPTYNILWAKLLQSVSDYYAPVDATVMNVYSEEPSNTTTGQIYMVDKDGNSNDLEESTYIHILSSDPESPEEGQWWITDPDSSDSLDPSDVTLGTVSISETDVNSPVLGQVYFIKESV